MLMTEILLSPQQYQEIEIPEGSLIQNAMIKQDADIVLIVEESNEPIVEKVGIYILQSETGLEEYVAENYVYLNSIKFLYKNEMILFHIFYESKHIVEEDEFENFNFN